MIVPYWERYDLIANTSLSGVGNTDMRSYLSNCKRIEEISSILYQQLASDEAYDIKVREVFQKLSKDEKAHARQIDLVLQSNENEIEVTEMIAGEKLNDALTLAEDLCQQVQKENLNEENALRLAVQMETQFVKVHVNNALHFHNLKLSELFNKLGSEEEAHLNTLKKCLKWWHAERKLILKGG